MKKINWRYALGELLIVIIGISIAFALNNWAEKIRDEDEGKAYLQSLEHDLDHDLKQLDSNLVEVDKRIDFLRSLTPHLFANIPGRDSMAMHLFKMVDPVTFRPMEATIQSLKFSGDLKLITDLDLKNQVMEHYSVYDEVEMEFDRQVSFVKEYLAPYFMQNIDYSKLSRGGGLEFLDDPYFRNLVFSLMGVYQIERKVQAKAQQSALELKAMLAQ